MRFLVIGRTGFRWPDDDALIDPWAFHPDYECVVTEWASHIHEVELGQSGDG